MSAVAMTREDPGGITVGANPPGQGLLLWLSRVMLAAVVRWPRLAGRPPTVRTPGWARARRR